MSDAQAGTAVAVVGALAQDPMALIQGRIFGAQKLGLLTSLPMVSPADKVKVLRFTKGDSDTVSKWIGKTVEITDFVMHPITIADQVNKQTGEIKYGGDAVRTVLILKNGKTIAAVSAGIVKELEQLAAVWGEPSWPQGVKVEVQQIETRGGNRTYQLLPVL